MWRGQRTRPWTKDFLPTPQFRTRAKGLLPRPYARPQILTPGRSLALGPKFCFPGRTLGRRFSPQAEA